MQREIKTDTDIVNKEKFMELSEIRQRIDEIDKEMVSLFVDRMNCAAEVAQYKKDHGIPVLDATRERALLSKISELAGSEFESYARTLYSTLLSLSRSYQHKQLDDTSALYNDILHAIDST